MTEQMLQIAARLKEIREISGFSPQEVAEQLNISVEQYLGYEQNGENIPISVLYQLAFNYKIDINELLTGKSPNLTNYALVRQGQGHSVERYPGYHFQSLARKFKRRIMEPLMVTVEPGAQEVELVAHPGQEFNYVVEGTMMITLADEEITLETGECIYFDTTIPHAQKALGGRAAKFLTVIAE